jgi:hypothetical protein
MNLIPVEGQKDLYRDPKSNAIVNTNKNDYDTYITRRNKVKDEQSKINELENEITTIKTSLDEIKILLRSIINEPR